MIAPWAADYVGIPFVATGLDRAGANCWGLLRLVYREVYGIDLPSHAERYDDKLSSRTIADLIATESAAWSPAEPPPRVGDAVVLRVTGLPIHLGVLVSDRDFLHTVRGQNSVVERLDAPMWQRRILGFMRHEALRG